MSSVFKNLFSLVIGVLILSGCEDDDAGTDIPQLSTLAVIEITPNISQSGGNVYNDGGAPVSSRGVVWNLQPAPDMENTLGFTDDGGGPGVFISTLSGLSAGQTYYVRAYATNAAGTAYGQQIEFTTEDSISTPDYPHGTIHCFPGGTEVVEVINPITGKIWMDRNLGAAQVATSATDEAAYGDLYQWGRFGDGHQCRSSVTTTEIASTSSPAHSNFIVSGGSDGYNWLNPRDNNLWQGVDGINNPCPEGFRLPTETEWLEEINEWTSNNTDGAFGSPLKLTTAGRRHWEDGSLRDVGTRGFYQSATLSGTFIRHLIFSGTLTLTSGRERATGLSMRCIKD